MSIHPKKLIQSVRSLWKRMPLLTKASSLALVLLLVGLAGFWQFKQPSPVHEIQSQKSTTVQNESVANPQEVAGASTAPASSPATSSPAPAAQTPKASTPAPAKPKSNIPAGSYTTPPVSTEFKVGLVTLQQVTNQCSAYQRFYYVHSAWVGFTSSQHVAGKLRWYWEAKIDSGENNSGQPAVDGYVYERQIPTGQGSVELVGSPQPSELFVTGSHSTYGYSFRLHVIAPTDAVSSWVSVPQGGC